MGGGGGGWWHIPPFKKCFCPHPPPFSCKDVEKAEFVAFSQILSRNQEVIKGAWSRKIFFLLFSFESFKAFPSTFPSPHEVCTHFPMFPPTFRSATTPLAVVSEKIGSHHMNQKLLYPRYRSRKMCCWLTMYMVGKCLFKWSIVVWEDSSVYGAF